MIESTTTPSDTSVDIPAGARRHRRSRRLAQRLVRRPELAALTVTVAVYVFFAVASRGSGFVSVSGTASWLNVAANLGLLAVPVALLMIAGEFDLSIGSVVGASTMIVALGVSYYGGNVWLAILLALAFGALVGLLNGILTVRTGMPSFIVTIATNIGVLGASLAIAQLLTSTTNVSLTVDGVAHTVFASQWHQLSAAILWWLAAVVVGIVTLTTTRFGNWIFATGGNLQVARSAGVPTSRVKVTLFVSTATVAALVGVIQAIEFNTGSPTSGSGYVFQAPIVAVIGGVLLTGGYGSIAGVFFGACIYGILSIGAFYTGWDSNWIQVILAVLLVLAVLANNSLRKLATTARG